MSKRLRHLLFWMAVAWSASSNAQTINLSTGWNNGVVAPGTPDDTWTVLPFNQIGEVIPRACSLNPWAVSVSSQWISPNVTNAAPFQPTNAALAGLYTYNARFTLESLNGITCARLDIDAIGADNRIVAMQINGNPYPLTLPIGNHFNPLTNQNVMLVVDLADLNQGLNMLSFTVQNQGSFTGFNFSGNLIVDGFFNILPDVSGPATICEGSPLTFSGSLAAGSDPSTHYQWKVVECDAAGNIVSGGFNWEFWYVGVPSQYTFPSSLNLACNKYYKVILAAVRQSECDNWAQDTHVFKYACKPQVNAGEDKTICQSGECVTIGTNTTSQNTSYTWSANGTTAGTGLTISVCPEVTTTYTLTATNNLTGCTSTDQVTVTVVPNDPSFELHVIHHGNYATVTATTNGTNANTAGFGQYWSLEVITTNNIGTYTYTIQNPPVWWPHTPVFTFRGFNNTGSYPLSGTTSTLSPFPGIGRFAINRRYRITRGTWSNDCGWKAESRELRVGEDGYYHITSSMPVREQPTEMAQEATADIWNISPNPSNGIFNISTGSEIRERTTVEVFDMYGRKIESKVFKAGTTLLPIDISGNDKGTYILNITTGDGSSIKKLIILE